MEISEKTKVRLSLYIPPFIIMVILAIMAQSSFAQNQVTIAIQSNSKIEKTITIDGEKLLESLEKLELQFEKFVTEIEQTGFEIIEVNQLEKDIELLITKSQNNTKEVTILRGAEAQKYLDEKQKEAKANIVIEPSKYGFTYSSNQKTVEIDLQNLLTEMGIDLNEEKKTKRKILIIDTKPNSL